MQNNAPNRGILLILLSIQLLFGLNYIFSKVIMQFIPPLVWGSIRCAATALFLTLISLALKKLDFTKAVKNWKPFLIFSILGVVVNQGCFLLGLHRTTPTNSALLNTLIPIFTILIVSFRGVEEFTRQKLLGFAIAFSGVLLLQKVENLSLNNETFTGDVLTLANAFFYSLFLGFSQKFFSKNDFLWATTWLFIFGTPGFLAFSAFDWAIFHWPVIPFPVVTAGLANILLGTVAPYLLIGFTLSRANSSLIALFIYIQPLVASILAYLFFGHVLTLRTLFSAVLIFAGVLVVLYKKQASAEKISASSHSLIKNEPPLLKKSSF